MMGVVLSVMSRDENVWLQVAGVVIDEGKWLVVKHPYGGLANQWSLPTGFVKATETMDEAAARHIYEATGVKSEAEKICSIRTGVMQDGISDHVIIFQMKKISEDIVDKKQVEISYITPEEILKEQHVSRLIKFLLKDTSPLSSFENVNPGHQFEYKRYKIFRA